MHYLDEVAILDATAYTCENAHMIDDSLLTASEVAASLGIQPGAVRVAVSMGKIRAERIAGTPKKAGLLLIRRTEMEEYRRTRLGKRGKRGPTKTRKAETVTTAA